jgi:hypothetical protein
MPSHHISTWLDKIQDNRDEFRDQLYEEEIKRVFGHSKTDAPWQMLTNVTDLARATSLHQFRPSSKQWARFWFLSGKTYVQHNRMRLAHEAFDLCQREIEPRDPHALLRLHSLWVKVTSALHYRMAAYQSCNVILALFDQKQLPRSPQYYQVKCQCRVLLAELTR